MQSEYQNLWDEFQKTKSKEAIFVHEVDKLEMAFQAKQYINNGFHKKSLTQFLETAKSEIKNPHLQEILNKLL